MSSLLPARHYTPSAPLRQEAGRFAVPPLHTHEALCLHSACSRPLPAGIEKGQGSRPALFLGIIWDLGEKKERKVSLYKVIMLMLLTIFLTFMITSLLIYGYFINGKQLGKYVLVTSSENEENIADELSKYKTIIDKYFFGDVDEEKLKEGAIKGYIEGLDDPYTEYISKEDMKEYLEDTKGNFVGIGIYMVKNTSKDRIEVLSPIKNSPAEKARN